MPDEKVDIVIIGGGIVGIATAYYLAKKGVKNITLLERDIMLGNGSTSRSAGGIRQQFSSDINIKLMMAGVKLYEKFDKEVGGHAEFNQFGYLFLAVTPEEVKAFKRNVALQMANGLDVKELSKGEISMKAPYLNIEDVAYGTFCQTDGYADPHGAIQGYWNRCKELGVKILFQTEVKGFKKTGNHLLTVLTNNGEIQASTFINCGGAWSGIIGEMAGADIPVKPYRRMIFITKPFKEAIPVDMPLVVDFHSGVYMRRESGGILMGLADKNEPSSFNTNIDWSFLEVIIEKAMHRIPILAEAEIMRGWAGLYDTSPDDHALIGKVPNFTNFYVASGFSGHGFMQGPISAKLLAELIVDGNPSIDIHQLRVERFKEGELLHEANVF